MRWPGDRGRGAASLRRPALGAAGADHLSCPRQLASGFPAPPSRAGEPGGDGPAASGTAWSPPRGERHPEARDLLLRPSGRAPRHCPLCCIRETLRVKFTASFSAGGPWQKAKASGSAARGRAALPRGKTRAGNRQRPSPAQNRLLCRLSGSFRRFSGAMCVTTLHLRCTGPASGSLRPEGRAWNGLGSCFTRSAAFPASAAWWRPSSRAAAAQPVSGSRFIRPTYVFKQVGSDLGSQGMTSSPRTLGCYWHHLDCRVGYPSKEKMQSGHRITLSPVHLTLGGPFLRK